VILVVREGFFLKRANFSRLANERYDDSMRYDTGKLLTYVCTYARVHTCAYNHTCK